MKNFEELEEFIVNHPNNWQDRLKKPPYNLQSVKQFDNNPNWWMLVYNLFESDLDNKIVKECRGTVVEVINDSAICVAKVICAPYIKFFDINDVHADKINWDSKKLKCISKIDGQLVKCFKYKGKDYWVTNGGTGLHTPLDYETVMIKEYRDLVAAALSDVGKEYTKEADESEIVYSRKDPNDFHCHMKWCESIPDGWTLMFELTSPQNRIICKYDKPKMWLHGARDPEGIEHSPEEVKELFNIPYDYPKHWDLNKKEEIFETLKTFNGEEQEGFVVVDEETWSRVKMKSPSYLALKYVRDNDTPEGIWHLCVLENHDDFPELKEKTDKQVEEINNFKKEFISTVAYAKNVYENDYKRNRKEYASWVNDQVLPPLRPIYFSAIGKEPKEVFDNWWKHTIEIKDGYDRYLQILDLMVK